MAMGAAAGAVWLLVMLTFGVNPISRFGPTLYLVPPFLVMFFGTRTDDSGRMALLVWYDAILARMPNRRKTIRNPLLEFGGYTRRPVRINTTTELHPRKPGIALTPSAGRTRKGNGT
jgi:hypothetical protein